MTLRATRGRLTCILAPQPRSKERPTCQLSTLGAASDRNPETLRASPATSERQVLLTVGLSVSDAPRT